MLEDEGVEFRANDTLDLTRYRWTPPEYRREVRKKPARRKAKTRRKKR